MMYIKYVQKIFLILIFIQVNIDYTFAQNIISVSDTSVNSNQLIWAHVNLINKDTIVAFQFDLLLPSSITYKDSFYVSNRFQDHSVMIKKIDDSKLRVLCFSPSNKFIMDTAGTILNLQFNTLNTTGKFLIKIDSPILVGNNSKYVSDSVINGEITISSITKIPAEPKQHLKMQGMIYPNPFNGATNINYYTDSTEPVKILVFNTLGENVFEKTDYPRILGWNQAYLQLDNLSSGFYAVRLILKKEFIDFKAIIMK